MDMIRRIKNAFTGGSSEAPPKAPDNKAEDTAPQMPVDQAVLSGQKTDQTADQTVVSQTPAPGPDAAPQGGGTTTTTVPQGSGGAPTTIYIDPNAPQGTPGTAPAGTPPAAGTTPPANEAKDKERVRELVQRIAAQAKSTSGDFKMDVMEGPLWAYDFQNNCIYYPAEDLAKRSDDYALGVIFHESGHRRYSKWIIEEDMQQNEPFLFLNNAVEDPRVNNIIGSRFEGTKKYFDAVYQEDLFTPDFTTQIKKKYVDQIMEQGKAAGKQISQQEAEEVVDKMPLSVPRHLQFGMGVIYDWYTGGQMDPRIKDKKVQEAIKQTAADFREAFGLKRETLTKDLTPREIDKQAKEAYKIIRDKIWPVYQKLVEEDKKDLSNGLSKMGSGSGSGKSGKSGGSGQSNQNQQNQQSEGGGQSGSSSGAGGSGKPQPKPPSGGVQGGPQNQQPQQGNQNQQNQQGGNQNQQTGDKQQQGGGGGQQDKKDAGDKQQQGGGGGDKKMTPEEAKEMAEKIIDGLAKDMNKNLEQKDENARRGGQGTNPQTGKPNQGNQQGKQSQGQGDKQGQDKQQGDKQGDQGDKQGDQGDKQGDQGDKQGDQGDKQGQDQQGQGQDQQGQSQDQGKGSSGRQTSEIDLPTLEELLKKKMELEARTEAMKSPYERILWDVVKYSEEMAGELKNILHEDSRPRFIGPFRSGKKLSVPRAMQSEAKYERTGEYDNEIWDRRTNPTARGHEFFFVVDESGSMRGGEKWDNALKALVMGGEALEQLKTNFAVIGFSDRPQVHKTLSDKYDTKFREEMIGRVENSESGGTNDADAIKESLEMVKKQGNSSTLKTIIVISDGEGKESEVAQLIKEAEKEGIRIIGVGIGDGMASVAKVYPEHALVDDISMLPSTLCELVRKQIEDGVGGEE